MLFSQRILKPIGRTLPITRGLLQTKPNITAYNTINKLKPNINQIQQRNVSYTAIPRLLFSVFRLPISMAAIGAGGAGYVHYKVTTPESYLPDWMINGLHKTGEAFSSIGETGSAIFEEFELLFSSLNSNSGSSSQSSGGYSQNNYYQNQPNSDPNPPPQAPAYSSSSYSSHDDNGEESNGQFSSLIKKLIEIRTILSSVQHNALNLPSIVVVGSQSSGKSSVLEAIVGKEFLPKGDNMVTRRPIELTLIHSPNLTQEFGVFPQLGPSKITDFNLITSQLTELNLQVSDKECISEEPVQLHIYSPSVPDLTLIDLPGYIQIHTKDQPSDLKPKIRALCRKYLAPPNLILAVCPADVDLANSEALLESRRADPSGQRTLGVVTKLDLVDPALGASILLNHDYPLNLGYVGVICKKNKTSAVSFSRDPLQHPSYQSPDIRVGIQTLQSTLIRVLEQRMLKSLHSVTKAVQDELQTTKYQYKVEYNDRRVTAESYTADTLDNLKRQFQDLSIQLNRGEVQSQLELLFDEKVLDICAQTYWADPQLTALTREAARDLSWLHKLDLSSASLTRSGIGKMSTDRVIENLTQRMDNLTQQPPFCHHEGMSTKLNQFAHDIIQEKYQVTVDQVENTIKPYKYEVDCSQSEWSDAQDRTVGLLKREINMCEAALAKIRQSLGPSQLKSVIQYVSDKAETDKYPSNENIEVIEGQPPVEDATPTYSPKLINKAKQAIWLRDRVRSLRFRLSMVKGRTCRSSLNKAACPEVYLTMVASKLAYTSVQFIQVELLNEFFFQFPREVDTQLYYGLSREQLVQFAHQNPLIKRQLDLEEKRKALEKALHKLTYLLRELDV